MLSARSGPHTVEGLYLNELTCSILITTLRIVIMILILHAETRAHLQGVLYT